MARTSATGRTKSPATSNTPPTSSSTPASPISETSGAVSPGVPPNPPNSPKSFCSPCCTNRRPAPMRRTAIAAGVKSRVCAVRAATGESTPSMTAIGCLQLGNIPTRSQRRAAATSRRGKSATGKRSLRPLRPRLGLSPRRSRADARVLASSPHRVDDHIRQLGLAHPHQLGSLPRGQRVSAHDVTQAWRIECGELAPQDVFALLVHVERIEHWPGPEGSRPGHRDDRPVRCGSVVYWPHVDDPLHDFHGFERTTEGPLEINRRQSRCPVFGISAVWLRRLARRANDDTAVDGNEFQPAFPVAIGTLTPARPRDVLAAVLIEDRRFVLRKHLRHDCPRDGSPHLTGNLEAMRASRCLAAGSPHNQPNDVRPRGNGLTGGRNRPDVDELYRVPPPRGGAGLEQRIDIHLTRIRPLAQTERHSRVARPGAHHVARAA